MIVNGLPGSGKTTLATHLASELSLPLFRKDAIKETLADALVSIRPRHETSMEWSQQLGRTAIAMLWRLLSDARGNAIIESPWLANLRPEVARELHDIGILTHDEIWCDVPLSVARQRFESRALERHWIHSESPGSTESDWEMWEGIAQPLGLGTVHRVDMTKPVDIQNLIHALGK
ncbi:MAG: AAA family ATPase [Actinobacteria bacterium]|nr:AAA family ATPase [Actinomycetota bacterium]MSX62543.1 AAA family ATPase [Actinomycetota bacterium]MTA67572.1 AAA family ATPase [Actinomycetota bacterium]